MRTETIRAASVLAVLLLAGCGGSVVQKRDVPALPLPEHGTNPSRDFLLDGFDEDTNADVYGYFLIQPQAMQSEEAVRLLQQLAEAFWLGLATSRPGRSQAQSCIVYWPVQDASHETMTRASLDRDWDVWLEHYHFERALTLSQRIGLQGHGPVLVAGFQPLAGMARPFQHAFGQVLVVELGRLGAGDYVPLLQALQNDVFPKANIHDRTWNLIPIMDALNTRLGPKADISAFILTP